MFQLFSTFWDQHWKFKATKKRRNLSCVRDCGTQTVWKHAHSSFFVRARHQLTLQKRFKPKILNIQIGMSIFLTFGWIFIKNHHIQRKLMKKSKNQWSEVKTKRFSMKLCEFDVLARASFRESFSPIALTAGLYGTIFKKRCATMIWECKFRSWQNDHHRKTSWGFQWAALDHIFAVS